MSADTCHHCGCDSLASGSLLSSGLIKFRPGTAKFLSFRTADIAVKARMCRSCGAISMIGNREKLVLLEMDDTKKTASCVAGG